MKLPAVASGRLAWGRLFKSAVLLLRRWNS